MHAGAKWDFRTDRTARLVHTSTYTQLRLGLGRQVVSWLIQKESEDITQLGDKGCTAPMHGIQSHGCEVEFQKYSSLVRVAGDSWYIPVHCGILVHTGTYWYIYRKANSCTIALSIPITKGVHARTNGINQGKASGRERNCRFMVWDRMNWNEPGSDKYIHCAHVLALLNKFNWGRQSASLEMVRYAPSVVIPPPPLPLCRMTLTWTFHPSNINLPLSSYAHLALSVRCLSLAQTLIC